MAEVAYDLSRFAPAARKPKHNTGDTVTRLRARKQISAAKLERRRQLARMVRTLLTVVGLLVLVCAVLYTQTQLAELSKGIAEVEAELKEEKSLNAYLTFSLDNMTTLKNIEDKADEQGLHKMANDQITYFRVEDNNGIKVRDNPITALFNNFKAPLSGLADELTP